MQVEMKLSEWFKQLYKDREIQSIGDLTAEETNILPTKYGIISMGDLIKCNVLIKLIGKGIVQQNIKTLDPQINGVTF